MSKNQYINLYTVSLTSFGCFHSSIDKSLTTSHGVKEHLRWGETSKVRVLNEASALRTVIILDEMRQGTVTETKWDTLSFHVLLAYTGNDLLRENETEIFHHAQIFCCVLLTLLQRLAPDCFTRDALGSLSTKLKITRGPVLGVGPHCKVWEKSQSILSIIGQIGACFGLKNKITKSSHQLIKMFFDKESKVWEQKYNFLILWGKKMEFCFKMEKWHICFADMTQVHKPSCNLYMLCLLTNKKCISKADVPMGLT